MTTQESNFLQPATLVEMRRLKLYTWLPAVILNLGGVLSIQIRDRLWKTHLAHSWCG